MSRKHQWIIVLVAIALCACGGSTQGSSGSQVEGRGGGAGPGSVIASPSACSPQPCGALPGSGLIITVTGLRRGLSNMNPNPNGKLDAYVCVQVHNGGTAPISSQGFFCKRLDRSTNLAVQMTGWGAWGQVVDIGPGAAYPTDVNQTGDYLEDGGGHISGSASPLVLQVVMGEEQLPIPLPANDFGTGCATDANFP